MIVTLDLAEETDFRLQSTTKGWNLNEWKENHE